MEREVVAGIELDPQSGITILQMINHGLELFFAEDNQEFAWKFIVDIMREAGVKKSSESFYRSALDFLNNCFLTAVYCSIRNQFRITIPAEARVGFVEALKALLGHYAGYAGIQGLYLFAANLESLASRLTYEPVELVIYCENGALARETVRVFIGQMLVVRDTPTPDNLPNKAEALAKGIQGPLDAFEREISKILDFDRYIIDPSCNDAGGGE